MCSFQSMGVMGQLLPSTPVKKPVVEKVAAKPTTNKPIQVKSTAKENTVINNKKNESETTVKQGQSFRFFDDFTSNKNNWQEYIGYSFQTLISSQRYRFIGSKESEQWDKSSLNFFAIDLQKDFSVKVLVKWVEGVVTKEFGIIYCSDQDENKRSFFLPIKKRFR